MKIFAIILCALLSLGLIASAVLYYSPQATAINAVVGATKDFAKRDEISPLYQMLKEGSLEFSASEVKQNDENLLENSSLSGKIYFSKDAMMYENINIKLSNLLDISGNMYFSNDLIYIEEDTILNGAYGMKPKNFVSDLENSIFAADSGSKYAMDEDLYDAILRSGNAVDLNEMEKDLDKLLNTYTREMWLIVCKYAEFDSNTKNVNLNGTKKSARVITVEVDAEAMANIIEDAYDYLANDDQILEFIRDHESVLTLVFGEMYDASEYGTLADAFEEVIQDLAPDVEDLCNEIEDNKDTFETLEFEIVTSKFSAKLLKFTLNVKGVEVFTVDLGEQGMKNTDQITLKSFDSEIVYSMNKYETRSVATLKVDDEKIMSVTVNHNRGTFKLETDTCTISGMLEHNEEEDTYTLTLDKINAITYTTSGKEVEEEYETDVKIVIRSEDTVPAAPTAYNRLPDITEEDMDALIKKFEKIASTPVR